MRYYVQGHPQCLKNVTTIGFPSSAGMRNVSVDGALEFSAGGMETGILGGEHQDDSSCLKVMVGEEVYYSVRILKNNEFAAIRSRLKKLMKFQRVHQETRLRTDYCHL